MENISERTVELFERAQRVLRDNPKLAEHRVPGATVLESSRSDVGRRVHWTKAGTKGMGANRRFGGIVEVDPGTIFPEIPTRFARRTPEARLKELTDRLVQQVGSTFAKTKRIVLPPSVVSEIQQEMWRQGKPVSREEIERMSLERVREPLRRYAARVLAEAHRKGQANEGFIPSINVSPSSKGAQ